MEPPATFEPHRRTGSEVNSRTQAGQPRQALPNERLDFLMYWLSHATGRNQTIFGQLTHQGAGAARSGARSGMNPARNSSILAVATKDYSDLAYIEAQSEKL